MIYRRRVKLGGQRPAITVDRKRSDVCLVLGKAGSPVELIVSVGNGSVPCANCRDRAQECVVTARRRPRIHGTQDHDSVDLSRRVQQLEALLRTATEGSKLQHYAGRAASTSPSESPSLTSYTPNRPLNNDQDVYQGTRAQTTVSLKHVRIEVIFGSLIRYLTDRKSLYLQTCP